MLGESRLILHAHTHAHMHTCTHAHAHAHSTLGTHSTHSHKRSLGHAVLGPRPLSPLAKMQDLWHWVCGGDGAGWRVRVGGDDRIAASSLGGEVLAVLCHSSQHQKMRQGHPRTQET